ncbi:hypothetical protein E2C01_024983 [Portunus trituberculatus]|uniref:Uncharacterized protein n=1 Tax=Portunus trituberculatus TaxID=210409 RepID=A0A5B7EEC3_PORTR|nr:hypothetical protein [Portunus trituberculatus]
MGELVMPNLHQKPSLTGSLSGLKFLSTYASFRHAPSWHNPASRRLRAQHNSLHPRAMQCVTKAQIAVLHDLGGILSKHMPRHLCCCTGLDMGEEGRERQGCQVEETNPTVL